MSTAPVALVAATGATATTWTTASFTPAANTRLVAYIATYKATTGVALPTISDTGGLTWTLLASKVTSTFVNPDVRGDWFISNDVGTSPAARTVTVASTGAQSIGIVCASVLTSEVSGATVQVASGEDLTAGDPSLTFAAPPGATNITLIGTSHGGGSAITLPTGYTGLGNALFTTARRMAACFDITSAAQTAQAVSTNQRSVILGIELAPAGVSGGSVAKVWSGSAWVAKPVKVWSGSAWVTKPEKIWNGSAWV